MATKRIITKSGSRYTLHNGKLFGGNVPKGESAKFLSSYDFTKGKSHRLPVVNARMFARLQDGQTITTTPIETIQE